MVSHKIILNTDSIDGTLSNKLTDNIYDAIEGKINFSEKDINHELKCLISEFYKCKFNENVCVSRIFPTANYKMLLASIISSGDKILAPFPSPFKYYGSIFNRELVFSPVSKHSNFKINLSSIMTTWKIGIKAIYAKNPSLLSGSLFTESDFQGLYKLAKLRNSYLIIDESDLVFSYENSPRSTVSILEDIFVVNDISRISGIGGFPIGWVVSPTSYSKTLEKTLSDLDLGLSLMEKMVALALLNFDTNNIFDELRKMLYTRRNLLLGELTRLNIGTPIICDAGVHMLYELPNQPGLSSELSFRLNKDVGVVVYSPPENMCGGQYLRISFGVNDNVLIAGLKKIENYFSKIIRNQHNLDTSL